MSLEYASQGLVGVLTPQANTTVEPELALLLPSGQAALAARLVSARSDIDDRLREYFTAEVLAATIDRFANAPLGVVTAACTGASYLLGAEAEDRLFGALSDARGVPVTNAALAVCAALRALGASRVALVSPYPESLTVASAGYWTSRGFAVEAIARVNTDPRGFHAIYALSAGSAGDALGQLAATPADAVVMLGTGMPTLGPIRRTPRVGATPVISCMLALAWQASALAAGRAPDADGLTRFVMAEHWGPRFDASVGEAGRRTA